MKDWHRWASLAVGFVVATSTIAVADLYDYPTEPYDLHSPDGAFVLRVIPSGDDESSHTRIEVKRAKGDQMETLWACPLQHQGYPDAVRFAPGGRSLILLDPIGPMGFGKVVTICDKRGVLADYTLAELMGMTEEQLDGTLSDPNLAPFEEGVDERAWREDAADLFDHTAEGPCFAIWTGYEPRWFVFNLATGQRIKPSAADTERWRQRLRDRARKTIFEFDGTDDDFAAGGHGGPWAACRLLAAMRERADFPALERLWRYPRFTTSLEPLGVDGDGPRGRREFVFDSETRFFAANSIPVWQGPQLDVLTHHDPQDDTYGTVTGRIRLPVVPRRDGGHLALYLIPFEIQADNVDNQRVDHVARIDFGQWISDEPRNESWRPDTLIFFTWRQVLPGAYWLKVVWNRQAPEPEAPGGMVKMVGDFHSTQVTRVMVVVDNDPSLADLGLPDFGIVPCLTPISTDANSNHPSPDASK